VSTAGLSMRDRSVIPSSNLPTHQLVSNTFMAACT
jgi:hypothetical protein